MTLLYLQADCLVETQVNVYERFLSGMMAKDKKEEEKAELPDEDQQDDTGTFCYFLCCYASNAQVIKLHTFMETLDYS